ncbi:MAG: LacI family DNA-binding transcriptional regulator [Lachnospiraceae bacterium]|nr:LacI family DNA-binding transcriptional regulator [Lachnospiraceae bacterium]
MSNDNVQEKITIADVAEALGISKTTVSRAISGKGRIGEETRKRVLDFIEENNYRPSPTAKGLAESKTYNICWAIPRDSNVTALPFFQRCMIGISDVAVSKDYDILVSMIYEDSNAQLKRIVNNRKVDGVVLGRTLVKDENVRFLKESRIPFVVIGSTSEKNVIQIDNDHIKACRELTSILIMKGTKRFALIGGSLEHVVNKTRLRGFEEGLKDQGIELDNENVFMNCEKESDVERAVEQALRNNVDCILCMDDLICYEAIGKLHKENVAIPDKIKIASFYNSQMLENVQPSITSLQYDPRELGAVAAKTLFDYIEGNDVEEKVLLSYEVLLKNSTQ